MSIYEDDTHMILGLSETQGQVLSMYLRAKKCSQEDTSKSSEMEAITLMASLR